jgi:ribosomal protein S14
VTAGMRSPEWGIAGCRRGCEGNGGDDFIYSSFYLSRIRRRSSKRDKIQQIMKRTELSGGSNRCAMCGRLRGGKENLHVALLVVAAIFSACYSSAVHMTAGHNPCADQGPVKSPHSTMQWHMWGVLTAGSTGSALRAVRSPNLHITQYVGARSVVSVSITSSSSTSVTCAVCYHHIFSIITRPGLISRSTRIVRTPGWYTDLLRARSSRSPRSEEYIIATTPRYLLRDRDASYGQTFRDRVHAMAIKEVVTAARSPWQNPYVERVIGLRLARETPAVLC